MGRKRYTKNPRETKNISRKIVTRLLAVERRRPSSVIALSGELGSGKTTFVQGLGKALGIKEKIHSPTFVLMKKYKIPAAGKFPWRALVHIDAYRLHARKSASVVGLEKLLKEKALIVIEWAEKMGSAVPHDASWVHLFHKGKTKRRISFAQKL